MDNLLERVEDFIRVQKLCRGIQRILIAVSGGLDSMVLLHLLAELSRKHSWQLTVAHLNHQLRGGSSNADERLVIRSAQALKLRAVTARADVRKIADAQKLSIEMAARKARHEFLSRTAARLKIRCVALAHHADDQVELFFLRLLRGAGSGGLAGMKSRAPSPFDRKIELVRPLLAERKSMLAEYARRKKIAFREDASNAAWDFQRNRIRHELLPLLRKHYQPALDETILRVMEIVGAEGEFVTRAAEAWLKSMTGGAGAGNGSLILKADFAGLASAVQRRAIQLQLQEKGIVADYGLVEKLRRHPSQRVCVAPGLSISRHSSGALILHHKEVREPPLDGMTVKLTGRAGEFVFGNLALRWRIERQRHPEIPGRVSANQEFFDADKVGSQIVLRHWQPGDRFQPIGMSSAVKLQDLFTNQKIPRGERHRLAVAASASGELFWVEKLRISERFKLTGDTRHRLCWQWKGR